jgi:hypothetical protein
MRYFLGFLITIGLLILLIILLFHGNSKPKVPNSSKPLSSFATTDAEAVLTTQGAVNYDQNHSQIRITVDRDNVTYEEIKGYEGSVVKRQSFANNVSAYQTFLISLSKAGFTQGNTDPALKDERGYCPLGQRFVFAFRQGDKELQRFWSTNCGGPKTFNGNANLTITLFQNQVPNYTELSGNVTL